MNDNKLVIGFTGDIMLGRTVDSCISREGYRYVWGNVLPLLQSTDLNIVNLETTLTNSHKMASKTFNFKASPDKIRCLTDARVTVANLANNHILDFLEEGLIETIQTLKKAGIEYVGAGRNGKEASRPAILHRNNIRIGILGFTDNEPAWKAGVSRTGINYINISSEDDRKSALQSIEQLRKEADLVVISIHWGPNMKEFPEKNFVEFAHQMIDQGADIIHGHSAHNFQGIEVYHHKLILYDTGDFVDDYRVDPLFRNDHSFFFRVEADGNGITKLNLFPVLISDYQVNLAATDAKWSLRRMQQLSETFGTKFNNPVEIMVR